MKNILENIVSRVRAPVMRKSVGNAKVTASKSGVGISTKVGDNGRIGVTPSGKLKATANLGNGMKFQWKSKQPVMGAENKQKQKETQALLGAVGLLVAIGNEVYKNVNSK